MAEESQLSGEQFALETKSCWAAGKQKPAGAEGQEGLSRLRVDMRCPLLPVLTESS